MKNSAFWKVSSKKKTQIHLNLVFHYSTTKVGWCRAGGGVSKIPVPGGLRHHLVLWSQPEKKQEKKKERKEIKKVGCLKNPQLGKMSSASCELGTDKPPASMCLQALPGSSMFCHLPK